MPFGVNQDAITTNDLIKKFEPTLVPRLEEQDAFAPFFNDVTKPAGLGRTFNVEVSVTGDNAVRQAPGAHRRSRKRAAYEVEITIQDKFRDSREIFWEKIREGRINEVENAILECGQSLARARNAHEGSFLFSGAIKLASDDTISVGAPAAPTLPSTGQTPNWWNANDTQAPPPYGSVSFSAGHNHIETGITALSLDRLRVYIQAISEHGYGRTGLVAMLQTQEEAALLKLANVVQQNQTAGIKLRDAFQAAGSASSLNGLMGLEIIKSQWAPAGAIGVWDAGLAGLPGGGAAKYVELAPTTDSEDDKDVQATIFEAYEQFGCGILHKGAGYTARVA